MFQIRLLKPFNIISRIKPKLLIFLVINIFIGQLGIIMTFFVYSYAQISMTQFLAINLSSNNLYIFSIALLAASIAPFITDIIYQKKVDFKVFKAMITLVASMVLILMIILSSLNSYDFIKTKQMSVYITNMAYLQLFFYAASIFLSLYFLCVSNLGTDRETYSDFEDAKLLDIKNIAASVKNDSKGNKL